MSHASVLVALNGAFTEDQIEEAVAEQMTPFDENGAWFSNGSRWDWYVVGGRFTGLLDGYDPTEDPVNMVVCNLCQGSGIRPGGREQFGDVWFEGCNGCNGCHGKGKHVAFHYEPHAKDVMRLADLKALPRSEPLTSYAFLRNHRWQERERLGWFGSAASTECEIAAKNGKLVKGKCLFKGEWEGKTVRIISWAEEWEQWSANFYHRFIEPLPDDTWLAVVDYHV
jgi:hypothetical protein